MFFSPRWSAYTRQHNRQAVGSDTPGTTVTTGAASATKGSATTLIPSVSVEEANLLTVTAFNYGLAATFSRGCLDILLNGEVLIADLLMGNSGGGVDINAMGPKTWHFPLRVPLGGLIAGQAAGERLSTGFQVIVDIRHIPGLVAGNRVTTYGIGTVPNGTPITPGASGAEGAWTEVISSTTGDHLAMLPSFQVGDDSTNQRVISLDIGAGAGGAEIELADAYLYKSDSNEKMGDIGGALPSWYDIPTGTRMALRASNSGLNDSSYQMALHMVS